MTQPIHAPTIMKTIHSLHVTRHAVRGSLLYLWVLALRLPVSILAQSHYPTPYTFTTLAGYATYANSADGAGNTARFDIPQGVAVDRAGNVYVTDTFFNQTIRKVTPEGVVATLAGLAGNSGSADGTGSAARFYNPFGVMVDSAGNVYVADEANNTIRKVTPTGVVTTVAGLAGSPGSADGTGSDARFFGPEGIATDSAGCIYIADTLNHTIRKVAPGGVVTTLAGLAGNRGNDDGMGSDARFNAPGGLGVDSAGCIYVADIANHTIRKMTPTGVVTTVAGLAGNSGTNDGTGSAARFCYPRGVAVDSAANIYVADSGNHTIRKVSPAGVVTTLAGLAGNPGSADGTGSAALFADPEGVAVDSAGNVYVADTSNATIRKMSPAGVVTTLAGLSENYSTFGSADGLRSDARFFFPMGLAVDGAGSVYVPDRNNHTIRQVTPAGVVTTLAGLAGTVGSADGTGTAARFNNPYGTAVDAAGSVYVADYYNHTIRKLMQVGTNWMVSTLAGLAGSAGSADGTGGNARFAFPSGVAVDHAANVYVADNGNRTIRKVTPAGEVTTLATGFNTPYGVAVDSAANVFVADAYNYTICKVTPAGVVTTLAGLTGSPGSDDGTGSAARFNEPFNVAVDGAGNVYVADEANSTIRKVTPSGVVTTLAGLAGSPGSDDGTGSAARFQTPLGVAVDGAGSVYVADTQNSTIRKGILASSVPALILQPPSLSAGQFGFEINGLPGLAVEIESSPDLSQWNQVCTLFLVGGTNRFASPTPPQDNKFYRGHVR
jgi:streptogramin lyase